MVSELDRSMVLPEKLRKKKDKCRFLSRYLFLKKRAVVTFFLFHFYLFIFLFSFLFSCVVGKNRWFRDSHFRRLIRASEKAPTHSTPHHTRTRAHTPYIQLKEYTILMYENRGTSMFFSLAWLSAFKNYKLLGFPSIFEVACENYATYISLLYTLLSQCKTWVDRKKNTFFTRHCYFIHSFWSQCFWKKLKWSKSKQ